MNPYNAQHAVFTAEFYNLPFGIVAPCVLVAFPHPALLGRHATADTEYAVAGVKPPNQQLNGVDPAFTTQPRLDDPAATVPVYATTAG